MNKVALFYWPGGGEVQQLAEKISSRFKGVEIDLFDLDQHKIDACETYDLYIFGGSSLDTAPWQEGGLGEVKSLVSRDVKDLEVGCFMGKKVAFFGLGDKMLFQEYFTDQIKLLASSLDQLGAINVGHWLGENYEFNNTETFIDGQFLGLQLDDDNREDETNRRIDRWLGNITKYEVK